MDVREQELLKGAAKELSNIFLQLHFTAGFDPAKIEEMITKAYPLGEIRLEIARQKLVGAALDDMLEKRKRVESQLDEAFAVGKELAFRLAWAALQAGAVF